ncbi:MAG: N-acetylglutaminylglutamine synthetase [Candidatus Competibacteraceae bacterium]|nr:N-acetylglutaminylglutamine synthetase [Candidatus Competibacteraceae bacterium]
MAQEHRQKEHHKDHRLARQRAPSLKSWGKPPDGPQQLPTDVVVDCGWGRLIFAHTFTDEQTLADTLRREKPGTRDIALYLRDPHVVLSKAPQELFLDPSNTYRLWLSQYRPGRPHKQGFLVRRLKTRADAAAMNQIYRKRHMVPVDPEFVWKHRSSRVFTYLLAEDRKSGEIIGAVTGVDHYNAFEDPEQGSSLWCLAVDPQSVHPGVGLALVNHLAGHYLARGRAFMDLSVLHDNKQAIALYEQQGFQRVPVFCLKHKNPINEPLFTGPPLAEGLNPYATLIVKEARRRGIGVEVLDAEEGYFSLTFGGRSIVCRESLSELTTAVAMSRCDNKAVTRRILLKAGLKVPDQTVAGEPEVNQAFLEKYGAVVVKPARGEQGQGISVDIRDAETLETAIRGAGKFCDKVLLEQYVQGEDLRIIVIDYKVVAAAVRRPPQIIGNGRDTVRTLIEKLSRRRAAATGGESKVPMDAETERCVRAGGYALNNRLPEGESLTVRNTANLHTGGTIHDVTDKLHPELASAARRGAVALDIPVVGFDFLVPAVDGPGYVIIEANERPGLANHEPQPTAERFIDLLFPQTVQQR